MNPTQFGLHDFSDEVLYEIFKHLNSRSLLALMNCCHHFDTLVKDHRFWNEIDLSQEPFPLGMLEVALECIHANTVKFIKLRGPSPQQQVQGEIQRFNKTLSTSFATRCTKLCVLELRGVTIDFQHVRIQNFPKTLKKMVLNDCNIQIVNVEELFDGIDTHFQSLEELGIEDNDWLQSFHVIIFSRMPSLRWLSLKGCRRLYEFFSQTSPATVFGFPTLKYLDLRYTHITDSDFKCLIFIVTLKEILMDCPKCWRYTFNEESCETNSGDCQPSTSSIAPPPPADIRVGIEGPSTSSASSHLNVNNFLSVPCTSADGSFAMPDRRSQQHYQISDHGIDGFVNRMQWFQNPTLLERLSVRNYKLVTDISLDHLVKCLHLVFLDVSGTSVTLNGINRFKQLKPECQIVTEDLSQII